MSYLLPGPVPGGWYWPGAQSSAGPRRRLAPVFAHGISLGEPAGSADIDVEEVQQPGLDADGFGDHGGVGVGGGGQAQGGGGLEDGPAGGAWLGGGVAGRAGQHFAAGGQGASDRAV